jgi:ATP-dependent protease ClpP protease subunit
MTARLALLADRMRRIALSIGGPVRTVRTDAAPRPPWYTIRNADDAERAIVVLDGEIGWDVVSSAFARELRAITAPNIDLQINSPGGSAWDGYAIYNALVTHPATITAHIVGVAASAASFIAMAGAEIVAYRPSEMMIHDAAGYVDIFMMANPADLGRVVDELTTLKVALDQTSDEIAALYARRAGTDHGTVADWRTRMSATTWYTPDTALAAGLVDRINGDGDDDQATTDTPASGETKATNGAPTRVADIIRARHARRTLREGVN